MTLRGISVFLLGVGTLAIGASLLTDDPKLRVPARGELTHRPTTVPEMASVSARSQSRAAAPANPKSDGQEAPPKKLEELRKTPLGREILNPPNGDPGELATENLEHPAKLRGMVSTARQISRLLSECLQKADLCGQSQESFATGGPSDAYFDPNRTPGHRVLNKALGFLKATADLTGDTKGFPDTDELLGNLSIPNSETQILSLELLLKNPPSEELRRAISERAGLIRDETKPMYLEVLQNMGDQSPEARAEFLDTLYQSLAKDDLNTVSEVVRHLDEFSLSEDEFRSAISRLCYIKENPETRQIWQELSYRLRARAKDPDSVCS